MTTLAGRSGTALLVVDVQVDVVAHAHHRDTVVGAITRLVDRARADAVPVIWVQHADEGLPRGSDGWRLVPELSPGDDDPVVHKNYGDSFEGTTLEETLARLHVGRIVVAGAQTDACIRSTLHGAFVRGYDVTLVADAHTTDDLSEYGAPPPAGVIEHTNMYWAYQTAPGRTATVEVADDVEMRAL